MITLESSTLRYTGVEISNPAPVTIPRGLSVIIGPNGSGKTTLGRIIERGRNFATNRISTSRDPLTVRYVEFNDIHTLSGCKAEYYQQRYEAGINIEVPRVRDVLGDRLADPRWQALAAKMRLGDYAHKPMNALSSGELRKLLVINQLTETPDLLILDNPYIGLDAEARVELDAALHELTATGETSVLLLLCNINEIPPFAATVIPMEHLSLLPPVSYSERHSLESLFTYTIDPATIPADKSPQWDIDPLLPLVEMHDCRVRFGKTTVLSGVNWRIMPGERWTLSGRNGSGKSTLLSLIHADNPQAYSNDLRLFGKRRGTGETIWEIKRRIGYVSPEMHLYFNGGHSTGLHVVAQGLNDTVGQYKKLTAPQLDLAGRWLRFFGMSAFSDRPFRTLSAGEQRMLLLARTLIKTPPLLILDEPLHGLDQGRKLAVRQSVESLLEQSPVSLIYVTHRPEEAPRGVDKSFCL